MKTYLNIEEANKVIKRLRKKICCNCPTPCSLDSRTFYSDLVGLDDTIQLQLYIGAYQFYGDAGITSAVITAANIYWAGFLTLSHDGEKIKMVMQTCGNFSITASLDNP